MRHRDRHMWTDSEKETLERALRESGPEMNVHLFWSGVKEKYMPHRTLSSVKQQVIKMGLRAKVVRREDLSCVSCGCQGVANKKRRLCRPCYGRAQVRGLS